MPEHTLVISNAKVVRPEGVEQADVRIRGTRIEHVGSCSDGTVEERIDARGLYLLPGIIDPQVHFRCPGQEWKEDWTTGSAAAVSGGVTTVFDMPNNKPAITTAERMAAKKRDIAQHSLVNYNCFIGATPDNVAELNAVENVCGIKIFMGSSTGDLLVDRVEDQERIFSQGSRLIAVHAEDNRIIEAGRAQYAGSRNFDDHRRIRSEAAALSATRQAVALAEKYNRRLHILHTTTAEEVDFLRLKRAPTVSAEVCPQHLLLHAPEVYERLGSLAQMNPPIRDRRHAEALWQGLLDGTIHCLATDHAPHTLEEKTLPFGEAPSGMPGVETLLPLMLDQVSRKRCSVQQLAAWMSENPARLYAAQSKGRIEAGYDADLVLVDLQKTKPVRRGDLRTKVGWSAFEGMVLTGWPVMTIVMGRVAMREGEIDFSARGTEVRIGQGAEKWTSL